MRLLIAAEHCPLSLSYGGLYSVQKGDAWCFTSGIALLPLSGSLSSNLPLRWILIFKLLSGTMSGGLNTEDTEYNTEQHGGKQIGQKGTGGQHLAVLREAVQCCLRQRRCRTLWVRGYGWNR